MGNINSRKCLICQLKVGDYGIDYMCYIIGKGKYNGRYICSKCYYEKIKNEIKNEEINDLISDFDEVNDDTFENLR
tara:strand:- start:132 stop:359 length:228 start_codon:yes stop_codon:yes gene_type:complete